MADPTQRQTPKGGAYGENTESEALLAESNVAPQVVAAPPVSPVTPQVAPDLVEPDDQPDDEPDGENIVSLEDGDVDLNQILLGATQRPDEPVQRGLPGTAPARSIADMYDDVIRRTNAPKDVLRLAEQARMLGL